MRSLLLNFVGWMTRRRQHRPEPKWGVTEIYPPCHVVSPSCRSCSLHVKVVAKDGRVSTLHTDNISGIPIPERLPLYNTAGQEFFIPLVFSLDRQKTVFTKEGSYYGSVVSWWYEEVPLEPAGYTG